MSSGKNVTGTWVDVAYLLGKSKLYRMLEADPAVVNHIEMLPELIDGVSAERVLFVLDRGAIEAAGLTDEIDRQIGQVQTSAVFTGYTPNPKCEDAAKAARLAQKIEAQLVVGIGGGSCLDVAKIAALAASTPDLIDELSRGRQTDRANPLPLIAVPTTSGTGSDATHFAAIYVDGGKVSVAHPKLRPTATVLDARLHMSMPTKLAACTGLDALGQAMESIWAVGATEASINYARAAGELVSEHLVPSVKQGLLLDRQAMMVAARLAGEAINISKTTASHAMSYQLSQQFGLPHGHAVALTLGYLAKANAEVTDEDCIDPRGVQDVIMRVRLAASFLDVEPCDLPEAIRDLLQLLGLPSCLGEVGINETDCRRLAILVDPVRLSNNPRRLTTDSLGDLMIRALGRNSPRTAGANFGLVESS